MKDVKRVEVRLPTAVHQRFELTLATPIETDDLTIEDDTLDIQTRCDVLGQFSESFVDVPRARNELALARLDISESTEAIVLDFKQPIG